VLIAVRDYKCTAFFENPRHLAYRCRPPTRYGTANNRFGEATGHSTYAALVLVLGIGRALYFLADLKDQMKETLRQNPLKLYAQVKNLDKELYVTISATWEHLTTAGTSTGKAYSWRGFASDRSSVSQ